MQYIANAELAVKTVMKASFLRAYLIDFLPICMTIFYLPFFSFHLYNTNKSKLGVVKYIPPWFSGAIFKKEGEFRYGIIYKHINKPFKYACQKMAEDSDHQLYISDLLSHSHSSNVHKIYLDDDAKWLEDVKWAAGGMYSAGVEMVCFALYI